MTIDISDLSNAYVLCSCRCGCSAQCVICNSPTWSNHACVQQLWAERDRRPPHIPRFDVSPHMLRTKAIEEWIDLIDAEIGL